MSRTPDHAGRPALLALALRLAPDDRRLWLEDMADEVAHVAGRDRRRWIVAALGLALRWRIASWQRVPRPQLAVAVMALALLVGSPWLMRSYLLQTRSPVTETVVEPSIGTEGADARAAPQIGLDAATAEQFADTVGELNRQQGAGGDIVPAAPAPAEQRTDTDDIAGNEDARDENDGAPRDADLPRPTEVTEATEEPEATDLLEAAPNAAAPAIEAADPFGQATPAEEAESAAQVPLAEEVEREGQGRLADAAAAVGDSALANAAAPDEAEVVAVEGDTLSLSVVRATRLEIRSGTALDGAAIVDREVEPGERFLLLLPALVSVADGGALEAGELGRLGADGVAIVRRFVSEPAPAGDD